jgi:hypothetical protein
VKCLRERDIFRHGGKIPAMGMGKRPEKFRYMVGNLPQGKRKRRPGHGTSSTPLLFSVSGKSVEKDLKVHKHEIFLNFFLT